MPKQKMHFWVQMKLGAAAAGRSYARIACGLDIENFPSTRDRRKVTCDNCQRTFIYHRKQKGICR